MLRLLISILRRSTRAAPILVAYFLLVPGLARSNSSGESCRVRANRLWHARTAGPPGVSDTERALERP